MKTVFVSLVALAAALPVQARAEAPASAPLTDEARDDVVVVASRSGEGVALDQLPASATVIGPEQLEQRQTRIVSDVLRDVPGVAVSRLGAIGNQTQVRIRGSEGNHVLVLVDGIEVADPFQGEYDFGTLIADPAMRIEILRGQQSSLYGSDAIGGVINVTTLSGSEAPGLSARAEAGSFATIATAARAAGGSDRFDYAVSASWYRTDGRPTARGGVRNIGSDNVGATAKLNWRPSDGFRLSGVLRYGHTDADTNNSDNDPASPRFGYIADSPGVRSVNEAISGLLAAELTALDGRWTTTLSGQFSDITRTGYSATGRSSGNKGARYKGSLVSSLRFGGDTVSHRLTGAIDLEREEFQNTSPPAAFAFTGRRSADNLGLVAQYELTAGAFSGGASIRHDGNNRFADATTWRVQGGYRLPTGTRLRAAYGTGVKNPLFYELYGYSDGRYVGNPDLRPEKSQGWEAGIDQQLLGDDATIGVTYFDATLKDEIFITYPAPTYIGTPGNRASDSKQRGVELSASLRASTQLSFDLAYTHLDADENGVEEVRRPGDIASFNATFQSADTRFSTTLTVRHHGRMTDLAFIDPSYVPVTVSLRPYTLVNLAARFRIDDAITLFGRVENLFDADYEEVFSFATPGAAAYGGVRVAF